MAKPILLSVDDDSDVLRAIERDLRTQYGADYRVIGSDSPTAALELLKQLKALFLALLVLNHLQRTGLYYGSFRGDLAPARRSNYVKFVCLGVSFQLTPKQTNLT